MAVRFYAPDAAAAGDLVPLPDEEAQHLIRVLRLKAGAAIRVFDGRGHEFDAQVERVGKRGVEVRLADLREPGAPEPRVAVTLAQAVLKGDKMDDVVRDAVMIGAAAVQPIVAARAEVTMGALQRGRRRERWTRIAVSSAKQCGRATVPPILDPCAFEAVPGLFTSMRLPGPAFMLVEPSASAEAVRFGDIDLAAPREATVLVGPEGGWTTEELASASAACRLVTLGGRTLRADAMPLVALAALFTLWKEF